MTGQRQWRPVDPDERPARTGWWFAAVIVVLVLVASWCGSHGGIVGTSDPCAHASNPSACYDDQGGGTP